MSPKDYNYPLQKGYAYVLLPLTDQHKLLNSEYFNVPQNREYKLRNSWNEKYASD